MDVYHASGTGENDDHLQSFLKKGFVQPKEKWVKSENCFIQRHGVFFTTRKGSAQNFAEGCVDKTERAERAISGLPMLITAECNMEPGWQVDYEEAEGVQAIVDVLSGFSDKLEKITSHTKLMLPGDQYQIVHITNVDNKGKEPKEEGLKLEIADIVSGKKVEALIPYWFNPKKELEENFPSTIGIPYAKSAIVQVLRDYLVTTVGQDYLSAEQEALWDNATDGKVDMPHFKYTHSINTLPIKRIEVFKDKKWQEVSLPPRQHVVGE